MPAIVYLGIKIGFLALLWLFVLLAIRAARTDLLGPRPPRVRAPALAPRSAAPARVRRGRPPGRLLVTQGRLAGTSLPLGSSPILIGRAPDSTLVLDDDYASARHARLVPDGAGQWSVEDLGSTNGTYLDRTRVTSLTPLPPGVPLRIGKTVMELRR